MQNSAIKQVGLIPARGGSKGIPRKNCIKIQGKPLIAYTIEAALASNLLDAVIVSTDDQEIADIARHYGAQVPFMRPDRFASDNASDLDVVQHFSEWSKSAELNVQVLAYLRPTTPLKTGKLIDQCISKLINNNNFSSVRTVTKSEGVFHPYWAFKENNKMLSPFVEGVSIEKYYQRQLLPDCLRLNGVCDVFRLKNLEKSSVYGEHIGFIETPDSQAVDIDTNFDLQFFEFLLSKIVQERNEV